MDDNKFWLCLWTVLAVCLTITTIILGATLICSLHIEKMAELGYEETLLPGSSVAYWQKSTK